MVNRNRQLAGFVLVQEVCTARLAEESVRVAELGMAGAEHDRRVSRVDGVGFRGQAALVGENQDGD